MTGLKLGAMAASFEASAFVILLKFDTSGWLLAQFFLLHGAASAFLSLFVRSALPVRYRVPRARVLTLLFLFSFFIPLLGLIGLMTAVFVAHWVPRITRRLPFANIEAVEFAFPRRERRARFVQGGISARLKDHDIPDEHRMRTLLTLQAMPARMANPILREMLADRADDIRLVAYGMLDTQEKGINSRIHAEIGKLETVQESHVRFIGLRQLAELYWELVYGNLVQGDLRRHAIERSLAYLGEAMTIQADDPGLWFLKGRLLHANRDPAAEEALQQAVARGIEESRVLSYLAEIAFYRRDFAAVRRLLSRIGDRQSSTRLAPLLRYWSAMAPDTGVPGAVVR